MAFNNHFAHYSLFSYSKSQHSATPAACTVRHILLLLHFLTERVTGCQMKCSFDSAPPAVCINRLISHRRDKKPAVRTQMASAGP
jgi:hypothetical protein